MITYPVSSLNPLGRPHKKQDYLHRSKAKYRGFQGSWGAGKTLWGAVETACLALDYPGARILICRDNVDALKKSTWRTFYEEVLPPEIRSQCIHKKSAKHLIMPNQTEIFYDHVENPHRFGSVPYNIVWIDEAFAPGIEPAVPWLMRSIRGVGPHHPVNIARMLFTGTPWDFGILYKMFYQEHKDDPNWEIVTATMEDNPYLDDEYIKDMQATTKGVHYKRNILAEFAAMQGKQFPTFNEAQHVDFESDPAPPEDWVIYRGIDPAIRNTACIWAAQSPNGGDVYIYREYLEHGLTVSENAENIKMFSQDDPVYMDVIDRKATEQRNVETGTVMLRLWEEAGIDAMPNPDRTTNPSVVRLNQLFSPHHPNDPTIRIHCSCTNLIQQIQMALWEIRISQAQGKEVRRPGEFHNLDCLQYIIQVLDLPFVARDIPIPLSTEQKCWDQAKGKENRVKRFLPAW